MSARASTTAGWSFFISAWSEAALELVDDRGLGCNGRFRILRFLEAITCASATFARFIELSGVHGFLRAQLVALPARG
jgi:hypothetical protein